MAFVDILPHLNASLNSLSACCLIIGYAAVRRGRIRLHKTAMLSAFLFSALFLVFYLTRWGLSGHTAFSGPDAVRPWYRALLFSHTLLAVPVVPLSITLIVLGLRGNPESIARHRRIARWTLPIWLYVSVTGVVVYWLLYRAF